MTDWRKMYDHLAGRVLFWCAVTGDGQTPEQAIESYFAADPRRHSRPLTDEELEGVRVLASRPEPEPAGTPRTLLDGLARMTAGVATDHPLCRVMEDAGPPIGSVECMNPMPCLEHPAPEPAPESEGFCPCIHPGAARIPPDVCGICGKRLPSPRSETTEDR